MTDKSAKPAAPFGPDIIKTCIPHRDPMLMITKVVAVSEGEIDIENHVSEDAPFFAGHFPENPIMPGVLITETCAQGGAMLIELSGLIDGNTEFMAFTGIDKAKFRRPVKPNDTLCVHVKIAKQRGALYKFESVAKVEGSVVATVDFTASIMKF